MSSVVVNRQVVHDEHAVYSNGNSVFTTSITSSTTQMGRPHKRPLPQEDISAILPSNDSNSWYYPAAFMDNSEEEDLPLGWTTGNWGKKHLKRARWLKKGKMASWGPDREEWDWEERARKRLKSLLPQPNRSPSPPLLPHLRSPSPPLTAPYPPKRDPHTNFSSFVMDPAVQHSFRSGMVGDVGRAIGGLVEGEAGLRRALGRLWRVLEVGGEDGDGDGGVGVVNGNGNGESKDEESKEGEEVYIPNLSSQLPKIFISGSYPPQYVSDPSGMHFSSLEIMQEGVTALKDLQDDSREYVERLEEIREGLGHILEQRNALWSLIREKAILEMQQEEGTMT